MYLSSLDQICCIVTDLFGQVSVVFPARGDRVVEAEISTVPGLVNAPRGLRLAEEQALVADLSIWVDAHAAVGVINSV